jgi:hypothetical protein
VSDPGEDASPSDGGTHTVRALVLVVVAALVAILVLRHAGTPAVTRLATAGRATTTTTAGGARAPVTTTTTVTPPTTVAPPSHVTVQVLNGLLAGDLATELTTKLAGDGYQTLPANNTTAQTDRSVIYLVHGAPEGEAAALEAALGLKAGSVPIERTIPAAAPLPATATTGSDLIVVIGTSLRSLVAPPATAPSTSTSSTSSTARSTSTTAAKTPSTKTTVEKTTTTIRTPSASTTTTAKKAAADSGT